MRARLSVLLLAAVLLAGCGTEPFQPTHTDAVPLGDAAVAGQTFRPAAGEVTGVDLLVATYQERPDADGTLTVRLRASPQGAVLAETRVPGAALEDNAWVSARFGEAVAVDGQAAIEAAWDGSAPLGLRANVPPADVPAERLLNDPYPGGELTRHGEPAAGDLAFRVAGTSGPLAWVSRLARGAGSALLGAPVFAVAWLLLLGGAVTLAVAGSRVTGFRRHR